MCVFWTPEGAVLLNYLLPLLTDDFDVAAMKGTEKKEKDLHI